MRTGKRAASTTGAPDSRPAQRAQAADRTFQRAAGAASGRGDRPGEPSTSLLDKARPRAGPACRTAWPARPLVKARPINTAQRRSEPALSPTGWTVIPRLLIGFHERIGRARAAALMLQCRAAAPPKSGERYGACAPEKPVGPPCNFLLSITTEKQAANERLSPSVSPSRTALSSVENEFC